MTDPNCPGMGPGHNSRKEKNVETKNEVPVRRLRVAAGMTQAALAERAGVNIRQIQKIESGEINSENLSLRNAVQIAAALDVAPEALLGVDVVDTDGDGFTYRGVYFEKTDITTEKAGKIRYLYDCDLKAAGHRPFLTSVEEVKTYIDSHLREVD